MRKPPYLETPSNQKKNGHGPKFRPGISPQQKCAETATSEWQTASHRRNKRKTENIIPFVIPLSNKYESLSPKDNTEQIKNKCPQCNIELISKSSIEEHSQLKHEKTMHQETKKALNALQLQFNQCKNELMVVQEEKERLSIKVNDLKATIDIKNKITQEEPYITSKNTNETNKKFISDEREIFHCQECDFSLKTLKEKNDHILIHKPNNVKDNGKQQCYLCKKDFYTDKVFKSHVLIHHQSEFNCPECDFQAGASQIILSKHMNLRHRHESEQTNDTFKCEECNMQFSSKWNCNNHKRDKHEPNIE